MKGISIVLEKINIEFKCDISLDFIISDSHTFLDLLQKITEKIN